MSSENITSLLLQGSCFCLNEDPIFPFSNLFNQNETSYLKSSADEQLIIYIQLNQTCRLNSIQFDIPVQSNSCPSTVKIFANPMTSISFSDVSDMPFAHKANVTNDKKTCVVNLPPLKFKAIDSIAVFIEANYGDEKTILNGLRIYGAQIGITTDVSKIKSC